MSADNTIAIAKFPDGWRVTHAQAIENINFYPEGSKERKEVLRDYFGDSPLFNTKLKVDNYAFELLEKIGYVEYGIQCLGELEAFEESINNKTSKPNNDETEFFECDCYGKHHLIIARKSFWIGKDSKENEYKEIDVSLEFTAEKGDWESCDYDEFILFRFFKKLWWRLKEAFLILSKGRYKVEDIWEPIWKEKERGLCGVNETKRLGRTLIKFAEDTEEFWESKKNE